MTDRLNALVVVLDHDIRTDDCQPLIDAIRQLRGVMDVSPIVADLTFHIAAQRVRHDIRNRLLAVLEPEIP